jgi:hypothetical protein
MSDLHNPIDPRRAHHDMGGLPAAAVEATEHDYALWEKRIAHPAANRGGGRHQAQSTRHEPDRLRAPPLSRSVALAPRWRRSLSTRFTAIKAPGANRATGFVI